MRSASTVKKHLIYVACSFFIAANPWVVLNIPKLKYRKIKFSPGNCLTRQLFLMLQSVFLSF